MLDCLSIASAQSSQQHDKFLVLFLSFTQLYKLFNDLWSYSRLQKLCIVTQQLLDCRLGRDIVLFVCAHGLSKEKVYPL
jgi:hypothetical protein